MHRIEGGRSGSLADIFQTVGGPEGRYDFQQDAFLAMALNPSQAASDLPRLFQAVNRELRQALPERTTRLNGSTAVLALVEADRITVSHIGDSRATLFVEAPDGENMTSIALTADHTMHRRGERRRIAPHRDFYADGPLLRNRKGGYLAMTRAFGDAVWEDVVIQRPDVSVIRRSELPDGKAYLCLDSDGAHEYVTDAARCQIMKTSLQRHDPNLAAALGQFAAANGSKDNITVLCSPFDAAIEPRLLGVFDGHGREGGHIVSAAVATLFEKALRP